MSESIPRTLGTDTPRPVNELVTILQGLRDTAPEENYRAAEQALLQYLNNERDGGHLDASALRDAFAQIGIILGPDEPAESSSVSGISRTTGV